MTPLAPSVQTTTVTQRESLHPSVGNGNSDKPADFNGDVWRLRAPWVSSYLPKGDNTAWDDYLWSTYREIAQTHNVMLSLVTISGLESVLPSFAAGETPPDVLGLSASEITRAASTGYILPLDHASLAVAGFNPADDRNWHHGLSEQMLWKGRQWSVQVASQADLPSFGTLLVYNRDLMESIGASQLENMAETGKWTWEYYNQLAKAMSSLPSRWVQAVETPLSILAMNGRLPVMQSKAGQWHTFVKDNQVMPCATFLRTTLQSPSHFSGTLDEALDEFTKGHIAFLWLSSQTLLAHPEVLNQSFDTGILPLPRQNSGVASSSLAPGYKGYCIAANDNLDKTVTVFNAWASRINNQNWPDVYGEALSLDSRLLRNHVISNRIADQTELEPAIAGAVNSKYITPLFMSDDSDWLIAIRADQDLSRFLRSFNAE
jgi:hypothetical protein